MRKEETIRRQMRELFRVVREGKGERRHDAYLMASALEWVLFTGRAEWNCMTLLNESARPAAGAKETT